MFKLLTALLISCSSVLVATGSANAQTVVAEEFNGSNLSKAGWNIYGGAFGSSANACFNPANVSQSNSKLKLAINTGSNSCKRKYSSAGVSAPGWATGQTYGAWEVVAKMPSAKGTVAYFGLYAPKAWPPEVVFEHVPSEPLNIHLAQHYNSGGNKAEIKIVNGPNWSQGFHTYRLEWTPGQFKFYIDGVLKQTMSQKFTARPMYLSIATGTYNCGSWGGCPEKQGGVLPAALEIESVKIFKSVTK